VTRLGDIFLSLGIGWGSASTEKYVVRASLLKLNERKSIWKNKKELQEKHMRKLW